MKFAKCETFEEAFVLCLQEETSIYIAIREKDGCEYRFNPDGTCFRITEFCPVCTRDCQLPNRIEKENHICPSCQRDYTPHLDCKITITPTESDPSHRHA
jgi:hypothetical protein